MTTQSQIRQSFSRHYRLRSRLGCQAWLIKGDFDHFKRTNDLYGPLICDYLLDWSLDVIEAQVKSCQRRCGFEEPLCSFVGDDVTIYIPPSTLCEDDVTGLLRDIRATILSSFTRRYIVGALPLPPGFFDEIPSTRLETIRGELDELDIIFDFARRRCGYLVLLPVVPRASYSPSFDRLMRVIRSGSGRPAPVDGLRLDWICDPGQPACRVSNDGFVEPPSISFAACPVRMGGDLRPLPPDGALAYERVSLACQSALKTCKQQRAGVILAPASSDFPDGPLPSYPAALTGIDTPLRWSSERFLRERFYFHKLSQPVIFQFNPVYRPAPGSTLSAEKNRGDPRGMGLKGINDLFGQSAADRLIGELMSTFEKIMQAALVAKAIPPETVHIAQFVDRFSVCCEQPVFKLPEIIELVACLGRLFNALSDEIAISHLRASVVLNETNLLGFRLFHQLTLASLLPQPAFASDTLPPVEVRLGHPAAVIEEASALLEHGSFSSAALTNITPLESIG